MPLHQVINLSSEKICLESDYRVLECVIQQLTTNQVHPTLAPNTSQPPPSLFRICGSSESTSVSFGISDSAEPTPWLSGNRCFSANSDNLQTYEGKQTFDDVTTFLFALEQHFRHAALAIGWVGTMGWGEQALMQQAGNVAVWAMHHFPMSTPTEW
jgi:hypothetical protein